MVTASATGMIQNDDKAVVSVAAQSATAVEGTDVFTPFTFQVTLDRAGVTGQTVGWSVVGTGSQAVDAIDFGGVLPSGFVSFAAGETSKVVTVWVSGDRAVERDEAFTLTLSTVTSDVVLGNATAGGTILNDDKAVVSISASAAVGPEGNDGPRSFVFTVTLDRAGVAPQSVDWTVTGSGVHAADPADFGGALPSGTVSFAPGETSKLVTITVAGDSAAEPDEDFAGNLFGRVPDETGAAYWTSQIKQALQAGEDAGNVVISIIGGARNSTAGQDITTLMSKVAVNLEYVHEQGGAATPWSAAADAADARTLLDAVTADPQSVLVGIANADRPQLSEG